MKTFKVLAFGNCGGESTDCTTSYGAWVATDILPSLKADTCHGNTVVAFSCADAPRNTKTVCTDYYRDNSSSESSSSSSKLYYGTTSSATSNTQDTCDGDIFEQFTGTPSASSCVDVYADMSGSKQITSVSCPDGHNRSCVAECAYSTPTPSLITNYEYLANNGIEAFCRDRVLPDNKDGCKGCFRQSTESPSSGVYRCGVPKYKGLYWDGFDCVVKYYKRTISKGSSLTGTYKYRTVTCCGNE